MAPSAPWQGEAGPASIATDLCQCLIVNFQQRTLRISHRFKPVATVDITLSLTRTSEIIRCKLDAIALYG